MAQMGATQIADLGPQFLMWEDEEDLRRNRRSVLFFPHIPLPRGGEAR